MIPLYDANPTRITPVITVLFLAANAAVFMEQTSSVGGFERQLFTYGAVPVEILQGIDVAPASPLPVQANLFTSMFMHGGFMHLAGNMLYLWIFGNNVEDIMGHARFVAFYLLCGLGAVMAYVLQNGDSTVPLVGASGAISGVLAAYLLAFPRARIYTLFWFIIFIRIIALPAWLLIGLWFLIQVSNLDTPGQIAWSAHVGGFATGLLLIPFFSRRKMLRW